MRRDGNLSMRRNDGSERYYVDYKPTTLLSLVYIHKNDILFIVILVLCLT